MNIINLTPHALNIQRTDGSIVTIEPSGIVARVAEHREALGEIDGFAVTRAVYGEIEGLPEPQPDTIYIVSALVLARTNRPDVFAPGVALRDDAGRQVGAIGLSAAAQ